jgi:hypothetical protein
MAKSEIERLDHGFKFKHHRLHKLLHFIMDLRKDKGAKSYDYEQQILQLARILVQHQDFADISRWSPEELWHYQEGHHDADWKRAVRYMNDYLCPPEGDQERKEYNYQMYVRNVEDYASTVNKPQMSRGFARNTEWENSEVAAMNPPSYPKSDSDPSNYGFYQTPFKRPDANIYLENDQFNQKLMEKLANSEYFAMILRKKGRDKK